jgi:hypothetical protein
VTLDANHATTAEPITPGAVAPEAASVRLTAAIPGPEPAMPDAPVARASARRSGSGRWLNVVLAVAIAVAIDGVAFAVGRGTNGSGFPTGSFTPGSNGQQIFRGGFGGTPTIRGTVESVDGDQLTIKTADGRTITVTTDGATTYHTQAPASAADVTAGSTVQVQLQATGASGGPAASSAPGAALGTAGSVTVVP